MLLSGRKLFRSFSEIIIAAYIGGTNSDDERLRPNTRRKNRSCVRL